MLRNSLTNIISKLGVCQRGGFAVNFAVIVPVLLGLVAGGIDLTSYSQQKAALQSAADAAALAAVREATLKGWSPKIADAIAQSVLDANVLNNAGETKFFTAKTDVNETSRRITVNIEMDHYPFFSASIFPSPQIAVSASATAGGSANICVIGLDQTRASTVGLEDSALMTAPNCSVYSNSKAANGLSSVEAAKIEAQLVCSAGGMLGTSVNFNKAPISDCPTISDPLVSRPAPLVSLHCDYNNFAIKGKKHSQPLKPGVYCGGLSIAANAAVTLEPGEYVIKDGPLKLSSNASMIGQNVGFYFTGKNAAFSLESGSTVDLTAPENGSLAGLLFFQDRNADEADFVLRSNKASVLVGTVYLPNGNFIIDTSSKIADASAYTAIVTRTLTLKREPNVVLNTDYGATTVPVPDGVGPQGGAIRLLN